MVSDRTLQALRRADDIFIYYSELTGYHILLPAEEIFIGYCGLQSNQILL
jgi:hypothetical protein